MHVVLSLLTVELDEAVSRPWSEWPASADNNAHCAVTVELDKGPVENATRETM